MFKRSWKFFMIIKILIVSTCCIKSHIYVGVMFDFIKATILHIFGVKDVGLPYLLLFVTVHTHS